MCCTLWNTQGEVKHLQQQPSGRATCVAHFGTPKARSSTSNSNPLGEQHVLHTLEHPRRGQAPPTATLWESNMCCTLWNTQGEVKHLQQQASGRATCVAHFGTPKARSSTSNSKPLGEQHVLHTLEHP